MTLPPKDLAGVREALAKAEPLIERMSPTEGVYGVYEAVRTALTTLDALLADKGAEDRWLAALSKVQQAEQALADRYSETTDDFTRNEIACKRIGMLRAIEIMERR